VDSRTLIFCILLSTLVIFLLSTTAQASEYREINKEVKAEDILKHIENGDDINLTNCQIVGELNLSKIELKTVPNPRYQELMEYYQSEIDLLKLNGDKESHFGSIMPEKQPKINKDLKVVESNITIFNSIFEDNFDFSYALFKKPLSLIGVEFSSNTTFSGSYFNRNVYFNDGPFFSVEDFSSYPNTIFDDTVDFSFATFNGNAYFEDVTFYNLTKFYNVIFNGTVDFWNANFEGVADFSDTVFNDMVDFIKATFEDATDFSHSTFLGDILDVRFTEATFKDVDFSWATFNHVEFSKVMFKDVCFLGTTFGSFANFFDSTFEDTADFTYSTFGSDADFTHSKFKDTVDFSGPETPENITTDGRSCYVFRNYYQKEERYKDADAIYYNYRILSQTQKKWYDISKWTDFLAWIICGYGVRPFNGFLFGTIIIVIFSIIYINPFCLDINRSKRVPICLFMNISLEKSNNRIIPFKLSLKNPGIVKDCDQIQKATPIDLFYYSIGTFTFMNQGNWHPRDNFKKWVTLEGVLGWITLGIFMGTLTAVTIRS